MNVLVTGGAGFIGSQFIRSMLLKYPHYRIINFDKLTYAGNVENVASVSHHDNYVWVRGDIRDRTLVRDTLRHYQVEAVVNFAAESHVDRSIANPGLFVETNVLGTQVLLEASRELGVARFVQISTDEVYGTLGEEGFFTEETPLAPNSPYSASKAGADMLVRSYYETYGLHCNITRCSNNYGPYHYPEKLIPLMIIQALRNQPLPVYGDGLHIRDWLHVADHAAAIEAVLHQGRPGEIYNIGGQNEYRNIEVVRLILQLLNRPEDLIVYVEDRKGHDRRYAIDPSKTKRELGWQPLYTFDAGIRETIQWYQDHPSWWQSILERQAVPG